MTMSSEEPDAAQEPAEEPVDAEIVPEDPGPTPELAEAVDDALDVSAELEVRDPQDRHEGMVAMDAHDVDRLVRDLTQQAQGAALRKWVYELPDASKAKGLSIHGVQDIVQRMSWTGKCSIRLLPDTLSVEKEDAETDDGVQTFYVATIFAEDQKTGMVHVGTSSEPQMMKLKPGTAAAKRRDGKVIRDDNRVFDRFARTKAVGKASRNALGSFIPEEVEQAVIAMAAKNPALVERIQTEAEAKVAEFPPPLETPEAKALVAAIEAVYAEIRELGNGKGKIHFTPGQYASWLMQSQHDLGALERMKLFVEQRRDEIAKELG
jgi:hypothetical protein